MKARRFVYAGLISVSGMTPAAMAQFGAPAVPAIPATPGATDAVGLAQQAQPATIWQRLGLSCEQLEACRRKKCKTPCGQLLNQMTMPLTAMTGGIIPPFCPLTPSPADLLAPGAEGAAAKIAADEANAKARRAAVRYLGTVDCHRWPEAEAALIGALRTDHNECVRFEAALSLGNGCCCTKKTMEALRIAASCSDVDGNPTETSDRVRAAAVAALEHCLSCYKDTKPVPKTEVVPERPVNPEATPEAPTPQPVEPLPQPNAPAGAKAEKKERPTGAAYYAKIDGVPRQMIVEECRKVVAKFNETSSVQAVLSGNSIVKVINRANSMERSPMVVDASGTVAMPPETATGRPQSLWEVLTRQESGNAPAKTMVVRNTAEPAMAMPAPVKVTAPAPVMPAPVMTAKSTPVVPVPDLTPAPVHAPVAAPMHAPVAAPAPLSERLPSLVKQEPQVGSVVPVPVPVRELTPSEVLSPFGQTTVVKPKQTKLQKAPESVVVAPSVVAKPVERQSMKPTVPANHLVAAKSTPSATAAYAIGVFTESHPPAVRESVAQKLSAADLKSSPELQAALLNVAGSDDPDATRKAAIQALVRNQIDTPNVMTALDKLADDPSPAVRIEAAIGMARLRVKSSGR